MAEKPTENSFIDSPYSKSFEEVLKQAGVDPEKGLSDEQVEKSLKKYGANILEEQKKRSVWEILLAQINNPVIYLLTAAAVLAFVYGDVPEGIAIVIVLLINTAIGFWMEYKAQKSMDALKKMDKVVARVLRNGIKKKIDAEELVPGDILLVEAGDLVAADARVCEATELDIDESPLTGESVPVTKTPEIIEEDKGVADRTNLLYKGTAVTGGSGKAVIYATGMQTELGDISAMVGGEEKDEVPLNQKLNKLTKRLIVVTIAMAAAFFLFGWLAGKDIYPLIQTSIAWTIAAIPEGLPIVASIALARGMIRLSKKNVIVKKLEAVETLGETTVIFTDKTGTLTKNELTVNTFSFPDDVRMEVDWHSGKEPQIKDKKDPKQNQNYSHILKIAALANDAELYGQESEENEKKGKGEGDPLDLALLQFASQFDKDLYRQNRNQKRKLHDPFDSDSMVMGTVHQLDEGYYMAGKGAAHTMLERCSHILSEEKEKKLSDQDKNFWLKKNDQLADEGLRVLVFAYKNIDSVPENTEDFLHDMTFTGLIGFIDPPRKEIAEAISKCYDAGIKVVMVTGDHPGTAKNVGKEIGLFKDEQEDDAPVISGRELQKELESDDDSKLVRTRIFSRVDPAQKLSLIKHFQDAGELVGMTGDGVNDSPALKKANIGIAMGKRGTQIAQEVSDMVLKDDAFNSIVEAIEQGRVIFGNIRKFIVYQLSYHLAEILIIADISFSLFTLPLLPLQLLFLNLLSDVFPALALGVGKGNSGIMKEPPKNPNEPLLNTNNWIQIGLYGFIITICVGGAYFFAQYVWNTSEAVTNNIAFFSLAIAQLLHVFNMRESDEPLFRNQVTRNKYIWMALAFCFGALVLAYFIPTIANILSLQSLELRIWLLIAITSVLPLIIIQSIKFITKKF
ncbi:MAG: cation-transporting P-type ATPase [Cyclobacteriaceae bacterium]